MGRRVGDQDGPARRPHGAIRSPWFRELDTQMTDTILVAVLRALAEHPGARPHVPGHDATQIDVALEELRRAGYVGHGIVGERQPF